MGRTAGARAYFISDMQLETYPKGTEAPAAHINRPLLFLCPV